MGRLHFVVCPSDYMTRKVVGEEIFYKVMHRGADRWAESHGYKLAEGPTFLLVQEFDTVELWPLAQEV